MCVNICCSVYKNTRVAENRNVYSAVDSKHIIYYITELLLNIYLSVKFIYIEG